MTGGAERAGDFLLHLGHEDRALGSVIGHRADRDLGESQDFGFAGGEGLQQVVRIGYCDAPAFAGSLRQWRQFFSALREDRPVLLSLTVETSHFMMV